MGTAGALEPGFLLREEDTQVVMNSREPSGSEGSGGKSTSCPPQAHESLERIRDGTKRAPGLEDGSCRSQAR